MTFLDFNLDPKEDMDIFWFNLGRETCNLSRWSDYCMSIVYSGFGKSSRYYNCLKPFSNAYHNGKVSALSFFKCKLDTLICAYYPLSIQNCDENILRISNQGRIIDIFFNTSDFKEYPNPKFIGNKRFPKIIKKEDKIYILSLVNRLKHYKYYIENYVINKICRDKKDVHKELKKHLIKFSKCIDKLEMFVTIPTED
jgi:hypothetical protein